MARLSFQLLQQKMSSWLLQGISPRRLALTLALGFVLGCFPMFGITTALCALIAIGLRLNLPAMQAANYAAMPLQLLLIWPFYRMGQHLLPAGWRHAVGPFSLHGSTAAMAAQLGGAAAAALLAWVIFAVPVAAAITFLLTPLLRRVPALAALESSTDRLA